MTSAKYDFLVYTIEFDFSIEKNEIGLFERKCDTQTVVLHSIFLLLF